MLTPLALADAWTPAAAQVALKATLLLAGAAGAALLLRRASASARHLVWTLSIAALLALPLLAVALPAWRVPVLPPGSAVGVPTFRAPAPLVVRPAVSAADAEAPRAGSPAPAPAWSAAPAQPAPAGSAAMPFAAGWAAPEWLLAVWAAGALLVLLRLAAGMAALRGLARSARPVTDEEWCFLYDELAHELRLRRPVRLLQGGAATMPMTWGTLRPTVLLPAEAGEWDEGRRRVVLLHELAHVQRLDCLTQTLAQVACALYWLHPGAWWAAARMRAERERACDDRVLRHGARASDYAGHLIEVARRFGAAPAGVAAVAMARPSQLEGRVLAVLDAKAERRHLSRRAVALAAAGVLAVVLPLAAMRPVARAMGLGGGEAAERDAWQAGAVVAGDEREAALRDAHAHDEERHEKPDTARTDPRVSRGLVAALGDTVVDVRTAAARALGERRDPRTLDALMAAARDPHPDVREAAAGALGAMEDPRAASALAPLLRDPEAGVRKGAAEALGDVGAPAAALPALVEALRDRDPEVRAVAAEVLGRSRDRRAVEPVSALLRDGSPEVRKHALAALGELGDPRAARAVAGALDDREAEVRATAAWALAELGVSEAPPELLAMAQREPESGLRAKAIWALGEIGDRRALPAVRAGLRHPSAEVQKAALFAVAELGDPESSDVFLELLRSPHAEVREAAAHALAEQH